MTVLFVEIFITQIKYWGSSGVWKYAADNMHWNNQWKKFSVQYYRLIKFSNIYTSQHILHCIDKYEILPAPWV